MIDQIKNYAPYIYLSLQEKGGYDLNILVPVEAGKTVQFPLISNLTVGKGNEKVIQTVVINGSKNIIEVNGRRFAKQYYLLTNLEKTDRITIFVENSNVSNCKNTYRLADADAFYIGIQKDDMAMNCPYLYLTKDNNNFYPLILLPVLGATYSNSDEDITLDKGISSVVINLQADVLKTAVDIVSQTKINHTKYTNKNFDTMECEVFVQNKTGTATKVAKKRKGKKRKADSDAS